MHFSFSTAYIITPETDPEGRLRADFTRYFNRFNFKKIDRILNFDHDSVKFS